MAYGPPNLIELARRARYGSQGELAEWAGVDRSTLSKGRGGPEAVGGRAREARWGARDGHRAALADRALMSAVAAELADGDVETLNAALAKRRERTPPDALAAGARAMQTVSLSDPSRPQ